MGWSDCGTDSIGRPIGYGHAGTCDEPGCNAEITRGLAYACGGMHGEGTYSCEGYYCSDHRNLVIPPYGTAIEICDNCLTFVTLDDHDRIIDKQA